MRQFWLAKKDKKKVSLFPYVETTGTDNAGGTGKDACATSIKEVKFKIVGTGYAKMPEGFIPEKGTVARAVAVCPVCGAVVDDKTTRRLFQEGLADQRMVAVVLHEPKRSTGKMPVPPGKRYRVATEEDLEIFKEAEKYLEEKRAKLMNEWGFDPVPDEDTPEGKGRGAERAFSVRNYGLNTWGNLFNARQKLALITFMEKVREAHKLMLKPRVQVQDQAQIQAGLRTGRMPTLLLVTPLPVPPLPIAPGKQGQVKEFGSTGFQPVHEFRTYKRNLPHWEAPGNIYFITFRTVKGLTLPEQARQIVYDSCMFFDSKKYNLYALIIMPNHVHLILQPIEKVKGGYYSLAEIMHSIKSYSANQINELFKSTGKMPVPPKVWVDENFDRIVRDENELLEKMNYIVNNTIKTGLVEKPEKYKWLYVEGWLEGETEAQIQTQARLRAGRMPTLLRAGKMPTLLPVAPLSVPPLPVAPSGSTGFQPVHEYAKAVVSYLAITINSLIDHNSVLCQWRGGTEDGSHTFGRQALPMNWDYFEVSPLSGSTGSFKPSLQKVLNVFSHCSQIPPVKTEIEVPLAYCSRTNFISATISQSSATSLPHPDNYFDAVFTDPPYYDNVPYSYLSDFFYVWLKRTVGDLYPELFSTPLTPKKDEIVAYSNGPGGFEEGKRYFESMLKKSFQEIYRVLKPNGVATIVYAHKSTQGWETLINSLLDSSLIMTGAWPINTEMKARLRANESAALASSIYIVARKMERQPTGFYSEVKEELKKHLNKKLHRLWEEGISGADFFIAAIGSAIEVFGRYEKVMDFEGNIIRADKLLDDVREMATDYAVRQILHNGFTGEISNLTRFYVLWRWNYAEAKVHFDEARKLAQSCGIDLAREWGKNGFIQKEKEFVRVLGPQARRMDDLGDSQELIDVLHLVLLLWEKSRREEMIKVLGMSGCGKSEAFYRVAQAVSETLPVESKEKKLLDGFLTGRERVREEIIKEAQQERLFT